MIGSLFNDLQPAESGELETTGSCKELSAETETGDVLVASLSVAERIIRRKGFTFLKDEAADILQAVALRLVKWQGKYREKSEDMSPDEWRSFTARTAYNEINRHYKHSSVNKDVPLEYVQEIAAGEGLEGQSEREVRSLALEVWQKICSLSLRQRQALILGSQELVIYFLQIGITDGQLAESLNLTVEEWAHVKEKLPLKNIQIAEILKRIGGGSGKSIESIAGSIKKARHEARTKLRRATEK